MEKLKKIIEQAKKENRIKDGLVICEQCDNPASMSLSLEAGRGVCACCMSGEANSFNPADLIGVE